MQKILITSDSHESDALLDRSHLHSGAELQIVVASTLYDGWITHFHMIDIGFCHELLFVQCRF